MKPFLEDLWVDLRQRRLWPVAALLLLALVAVPFVLVKPVEKPDPKPVAAAAPVPDEVRELKALSVAAAQSTGAGSPLDVFEETDPFLPPEKVLQASRQQESGSDGSSVSTTAPSADEGPSSGDSFGGGSTGGGSVGTAPTGSDPEPETKTKIVQFAYVIDVTFRDGRDVKTYWGMKRLAMLPSAERPLLIFLGVTTDGKKAVFLVDSELRTWGEGRCRPRPSQCATLELEAEDRHRFRDEQNRYYSLRLRKIRKVRVSEASSDDGPTADGSSLERRFVPRVLSDVVGVG